MFANSSHLFPFFTVQLTFTFLIFLSQVNALMSRISTLRAHREALGKLFSADPQTHWRGLSTEGLKQNC